MHNVVVKFHTENSDTPIKWQTVNTVHYVVNRE